MQMIIEEEEDYVLKDDQKTDDNLSKLREVSHYLQCSIMAQSHWNC